MPCSVVVRGKYERSENKVEMRKMGWESCEIEGRVERQVTEASQLNKVVAKTKEMNAHSECTQHPRAPLHRCPSTCRAPSSLHSVLAAKVNKCSGQLHSIPSLVADCSRAPNVDNSPPRATSAPSPIPTPFPHLNRAPWSRGRGRRHPARGTGRGDRDGKIAVQS